MPIPDGPIAARIRQIHPTSPPFGWPFGPPFTDSDAFDLGGEMVEMYKREVERGGGARV